MQLQRLLRDLQQRTFKRQKYLSEVNEFEERGNSLITVTHFVPSNGGADGNILTILQRKKFPVLATGCSKYILFRPYVPAH
jgi:hypothetical protein